MDPPNRESDVLELESAADRMYRNHMAAGFDRTTSWRIVFWMLVSSAALICLLVGLLHTSAGPDLIGVIYLSALVFLCCLLGAYAGFGRHPLRWLALATLGPLMGAYACYTLGGGRDLIQFEVFVIGIVGIMTFTTWVLKFCKGELRHVAPEDTIDDGLQFGIRDLLIWTTAVAVMIAIGRGMWAIAGDLDNSRTNAAELWAILGLSLSLSIATVINIWALFGSQLTSVKLIVVMMMTFASAVACYYLFHAEWFFAAIAFGGQFFALAAMFTLRMQRIRFVKKTVNFRPGAQIHDAGS